MNIYDVYCNEKTGYWRVFADTEEEAIYEVTKGSKEYTGVYVYQMFL